MRNRLLKRLRHHNCASFEEYYRLILDDSTGEELQVMIDLITTNETHFFRETPIFRFFGAEVLRDAAAQSGPYRVWSAAASSGEEAYSIAMVLADRMTNRPWRILASDINRNVLEIAANAVYSMDATSEIPDYYLRGYCLKGRASMRDRFTIAPEIRANVEFQQINLNERLPDLPEFDCIFLRNALIYFSQADKIAIVRRVARKLKPGGYLMIGLSESLQVAGLRKIRPAVFQKL